MKIIILIWTILCFYGAFFAEARVDLSSLISHPSSELEESMGTALWIAVWFGIALFLHVFENILHRAAEERESDDSDGFS